MATGKKRGRPAKNKCETSTLPVETDSAETSTNRVETANQPQDMAIVSKAGVLARQMKALMRAKGGDKQAVSKLGNIIEKITDIVDNKGKLSEASLSQLMVALGIAVDKKLLLQGRATQIHGVVTVHEASDRVLAGMDRLASALAGKSPQRVIDLDATETAIVPKSGRE